MALQLGDVGGIFRGHQWRPQLKEEERLHMARVVGDGVAAVLLLIPCVRSAGLMMMVMIWQRDGGGFFVFVTLEKVRQIVLLPTARDRARQENVRFVLRAVPIAMRLLFYAVAVGIVLVVDGDMILFYIDMSSPMKGESSTSRITMTASFLSTSTKSTMKIRS